MPGKCGDKESKGIFAATVFLPARAGRRIMKFILMHLYHTPAMHDAFLCCIDSARTKEKKIKHITSIAICSGGQCAHAHPTKPDRIILPG